MHDKKLVKLQLAAYLDESGQRGNLSVWGLLRFCIGYYGGIDSAILDAVKELAYEGAVISK